MWLFRCTLIGFGMKKIFFLIALTFLMCNIAQGQFLGTELQIAHEIKLLRSDREEVNKILTLHGIAISNENRNLQSFSTQNAFVEISYSHGRCSRESDWDVAEGKVTKIEISPRISLPILNVGFDYSKYRFEELYANLPYSLIYHDKEKGIAFEIDKNTVLKIHFFPNKTNLPNACDAAQAKRFYSHKSYFVDSKLDERIYTAQANFNAEVVDIKLSSSEIITNCNSAESTLVDNCVNSSKELSVLTEVKDRENDVLIYVYTVSGGQIKGTGENVLWDLSDLPPGTYTLTAAVDDGCGFCGKSMTKTVVIKNCVKCSTAKRNSQ